MNHEFISRAQHVDRYTHVNYLMLDVIPNATTLTSTPVQIEDIDGRV